VIMSSINRSLASACLNQMCMLSTNDSHHTDSTAAVLETSFAYISKLLMQAVFSLHLLLFAV